MPPFYLKISSQSIKNRSVSFPKLKNLFSFQRSVSQLLLNSTKNTASGINGLSIFIVDTLRIMRKHHLLNAGVIAKRRARRTYPEEALHIQVADYLLAVLHPKKTLWTSIEVSNQQGGASGLQKQKKLRRKGVKAGWPDILIIWRNKGWCTHVLGIELKAKRDLSNAQLEVQCLFRDLMGYGYEVAKSVDRVKEILEQYRVPCKDHILM